MTLTRPKLDSKVIMTYAPNDLRTVGRWCPILLVCGLGMQYDILGTNHDSTYGVWVHLLVVDGHP